MQPVRLFQFTCRPFEVTAEKSQTNAASAIMHLLGQAIWGCIWKHYSGEKSNRCDWCDLLVTQIDDLCHLHLGFSIQTEKYSTVIYYSNVLGVTMPALVQAVWGNIWQPTLVKSQTNATNVIMHPLVKTFWGYIWQKHTGVKCQQCDYASLQVGD